MSLVRRRRSGAAALGLAATALVVAACSGGASESLTEVTAQQIERTFPRASAAPSTRAVVNVESTAPPSTVLTDPRVMPLTGLPTADPKIRNRPALIVKMDNSKQARPQSGLNQADIVIEEIVEGITRFFVIFQSQDVGEVGPIRSARTQDIDLVKSLSRPLFTWSGGNVVVTKLISQAPLVDLTPFNKNNYRIGRYHRTGRAAPHNMYAEGDGLRALTPADARAPEQLLRFRDPAEDVPGDPTTGVNLEMLGTKAEWRWDEGASAYVRSHENVPHTDAAGKRVNAANVLVLITKYRPSRGDARSPEAQTVGFGDALIFTGGKLIRGAWYRERAENGWGLADANGDPIALTPGRTWIELAEAGDATVVP